MLYFKDGIRNLYNTNSLKIFGNLLLISDDVSCTCSVSVWSDVGDDTVQ